MVNVIAKLSTPPTPLTDFKQSPTLNVLIEKGNKKQPSQSWFFYI